MVTWVAYCPVCRKELDQAPNGALVEAVANRHADSSRHRVILGFFMDPLPGESVGVQMPTGSQDRGREGGATVAV